MHNPYLLCIVPDECLVVRQIIFQNESAYEIIPLISHLYKKTVFLPDTSEGFLISEKVCNGVSEISIHFHAANRPRDAKSASPIKRKKPSLKSPISSNRTGSKVPVHTLPRNGFPWKS
jgi:hypothetical protein